MVRSHSFDLGSGAYPTQCCSACVCLSSHSAPRSVERLDLCTIGLAPSATLALVDYLPTAAVQGEASAAARVGGVRQTTSWVIRACRGSCICPAHRQNELRADLSSSSRRWSCASIHQALSTSRLCACCVTDCVRLVWCVAQTDARRQVAAASALCVPRLMVLMAQQHTTP